MSRADFEMDEQLKEIALRVWKAGENAGDTRTGAEIIADFAARFLAALPKPEPVAYMFSAPGITKLDVCPHGGKWKPLYTAPPIQSAQGWQPEVKLSEMRESSGRVTHAVFLAKPGDKSPWDWHQVYSDQIKGRAEYEAAELRHFLGQGPKPDILAFDTDPTPPTAALADDVVRDAERYRWLAGSCKSADEPYKGGWSIHIQGPVPMRHDEEDSFDEAIDAAIAAAKGGAA